MRKKFKVTLVVFLVVILGCFSQAFAATKTNLKTDKSIKDSMSRNLLDSPTTDNKQVDQYTKLLMHMDDSTFRDECGHTVTNTGVTVDTINKKFGNGSACFNGSNAYLTIPSSSDFDFGSDDFTIEMMVNLKALNDCTFFDRLALWDYNVQGIKIYFSQKDGLCAESSLDNSQNSFGQNNLTGWDANNWHHIALTKHQGILYLWLDGKNVASNSSCNYTYKDIDRDIHIGTVVQEAWHGGAPIGFFNGNIDDLRVSKGIARWTDNFTPPTSPYDEEAGLALNKTTDSLTLGETDKLTAALTTDGSTYKNVTWTSSDKNIVDVDQVTGKITAKGTGTATITATATDGSNLSASCAVTVSDPLILNIEPEKTKINLNDMVSANLTIDNIQDIAAEDIRIKYDSTKLQFLNYEEIDGIKLVENDVKDGELRFILASKGKSNIINAKKILLKLNFKGISAGDALVDVTNGRVSDGITKEWDLTDEQCGQATITIQKLGDVDNSGEYTLLDLAIDARHEGEDPSTLTQYNTDQDGNKAIDDTDLTLIGKYMLENTNYAPNNIK